ncbi:hypothetical protein HY993_04685 [Candidatus Micrarchaeota archaeon]|nr:hypothetical protein [Candidatus Micrarchaeota archaeon]
MPHERLGEVRVTHLPKFNPVEVLGLLDKKPLFTRENGSVSIHSLGRNQVCIKYCRHSDALRAFSMLKEAAEKKLGLETPVALIWPIDTLDFSALTRPRIVTLWRKEGFGKKEERTLRGFLEDKKIPAMEKKKVAFKIVRALAKLHANGFSHNDVHGENILVNSKNEPSFVDYSDMSANPSSEEINLDLKSAIDTIDIHFTKYPFKGNLRQELNGEYHDCFAKYARGLIAKEKK